MKQQPKYCVRDRTVEVATKGREWSRWATVGGWRGRKGRGQSYAGSAIDNDGSRQIADPCFRDAVTCSNTIHPIYAVLQTIENVA